MLTVTNGSLLTPRRIDELLEGGMENKTVLTTVLDPARISVDVGEATGSLFVTGPPNPPTSEIRLSASAESVAPWQIEQ